VNRVTHKAKAEEWLTYAEDGTHYYPFERSEPCVMIGPREFQVRDVLAIAHVHALLAGDVPSDLRGS
jgi:hypothetical protein